jgi:hypothetical protein
MPDAILNDLFSETQSPAIVVDDVLGQILGVQLDGDIGRFRSALARAFPAAVNAATGATSIRYVAPSYAVKSMPSGTVPTTGALAGIQAQVSLLSGEAVAVLARLRPLHCACDSGVEPLRDLIRHELEALPGLFAQYTGPQASQIDTTFGQLTGVTFDDYVRRTPDPALVAGQIGTLGKRLGIYDSALTTDDEVIRTDFHIFASYVWMLETAWAALRGDLEKASSDSIGVNTRHLNLRLLALHRANTELIAAFDDAGAGPAERMTFTLGSARPPITLADLLSWIDEVTSSNGLAVIGAGLDGIRALATVVDKLHGLVCEDLKPLIERPEPSRRGRASRDECGDPSFLSTDCTKAAFNKVALQLTALCSETTRALETEVSTPIAGAPADNAKK